jgi:RimJ/RimL family protein N-acetyltransferase
VAHDVWGQGDAREALARLPRHAGAARRLPRLAGGTDVPNAASDRTPRRAGLRVIDERPGRCRPPRLCLHP